jgi:acyl-CoA hydrolase/RimJ/RimL family protein N-acetyltransferase
MNALNKKLSWKKKRVSTQEVLTKIRPGMTLFIGTGPAAPRTLMKALFDSDQHNIRDLELVQLAVQGDVILSVADLHAQNYRLKTFFSGFVASKTIKSGQVDLIPAYSSEIPTLINRGKVPIDVAFIQITPPDSAGYCSLGVAVDVAREAMAKAKLVVGEINADMPFTYGDTFVSIEDFDLLIDSAHEPFSYDRSKVKAQMSKVAKNVASIIKDGDCLCFSYGPLFEALVPFLKEKQDLGIHSLYFTDALAELVESGAVTNFRKTPFRGKSLTSYAFGSKKLMKWLHRNPLVEFQGTDFICNPAFIGKIPQFVALYRARKVDLLGGVAFPMAGTVITGPGEVVDFLQGAEVSKGGCTIFGLPSRNSKGESNILFALADYPNQLRLRESVHMIATEYGVANVKGKTLRERAQAMIDIAHPDDRHQLLETAKEKKLVYADQIFIQQSAHLYPVHIACEESFKDDIPIRFRAIKPSDEEQMRRFFYRFSDETKFNRFFYNIKTMSHDKMQKYVNVDYSKEMAIVGLSGTPENEIIVAEARFVRDERSNYGESAFLIDEAFQGLGIASFMMTLLIRQAKEIGLRGLTADVLLDNLGMKKVFEKTNYPLRARVINGVYSLTLQIED